MGWPPPLTQPPGQHMTSTKVQGAVSGDDPRLIARFLQEIVRCYHRDYTIRSVTLTRHAEVFRAEGFVPVREWKEYVAMEYGKNRRP